ncbi:hypothetical protein WA016_03601 [Myxococcus stipitatus]
MQSVVRQLIDEAPWGWAQCMPGPGAPEGERNSRDEDEEVNDFSRVAPDKTDMLGYVYVFDLDARRLDAFSAGVAEDGKRLCSVVFSQTGTPDPRALDLLPEETVDEPLLPGKELSATELQGWLEGLPTLGTDSTSLHWVDTQQGPDDALAITFRVIIYDDEDGSIRDVLEQEWVVVPHSARLEPERVRNFLEALVDVVSEEPKRLDSFWIAEQDTLRRSGARQRESFAKILRAHWARDHDFEA